MATLYVTEFVDITKGQGTWTQIQAPISTSNQPSYDQTISITGSPSQSQPFKTSTTIIRVHTDAICSIKVGGTNPTASTTTARMAANQTEFFGVMPGDRISVISNV